MFLLQALESFLGDIDQWPSTILNHLFIDEPTPDIIKRVLAFFYGNNIPYNIGSYFYETCSEYSGDYATNVVHSYYFIWRSARYSKHLAIYFNMDFKRYMYINGVCQTKIEPMIPEIPVVTLGIAATKFPFVLRVKLRLIRLIVMVFP